MKGIELSESESVKSAAHQIKLIEPKEEEQ